jgi:formate hydrogenlyase transcriptional activator
MPRRVCAMSRDDRDAIGDTEGPGGIVGLVGRSAALRAVIERVARVAGTSTTVLIEGETGTGKELVARAIHRLSPRKDRAFVNVNCAALPATLIESELFGHERGAFTDASNKKLGRFELADRGTLFLDEVGDLPLDLQAKLLRVLQEGEFERVGSERTTHVDVRVIAATNRELEKAVREGRFRQDLFYRLSVFPIVVPPLRDRAEDIPALVWHFIAKHQARIGKQIEDIPQSVMDTLTGSRWPGNVRQLEHVVEHALIVTEGASLTIEGVPVPAAAGAPGTEPAAQGRHERARVHLEPPTRQLLDVEREHIVRVLEECGWRLKGPGNAAARLGMNPSTLRSRMKKLGIERP